MQNEYPRAGDLVEWCDDKGEVMGIVLLGDAELKGLVFNMDESEAQAIAPHTGIALSGEYRGQCVSLDEDDTMTVLHGYVHINR